MSKDRSARSSRTAQETRRQSAGATAERASRDNEDVERQDDGLELAIEDREAMLRNDVMQNLLPVPPKIPGVHWFYASLNAPQHISWYRRLGYKPVRIDDPQLKGWTEEAMKSGTGDYAGCVTINEMLLMRIAEADYQRYMRIIHHQKPLEEQNTVRGQIDSTKQAVERESGGMSNVIEQGSGLKQMDRKVKTPSRFE